MQRAGENQADPITEHELHMWLKRIGHDIEAITRDKSMGDKFEQMFRILHKYSES